MYRTGESKATFESLLQMTLESFLTSSKKEATNILDEEKDPSIITKRSAEQICNVSADMSWNQQNDGLLSEKNIPKQELDVTHITEENTNMLYCKALPCNIKDATSRALDVINRVERDKNCVYLAHPGILYHMEKSNESVSKPEFVLRRYTARAKIEFTLNVHLDFNMIMDHYPDEYSKTICKLG